MIEIVESNDDSLREKIISRITKLESYVHEDDTPNMVKKAFRLELEHLRAELKEIDSNEARWLYRRGC